MLIRPSILTVLGFWTAFCVCALIAAFGVGCGPAFARASGPQAKLFITRPPTASETAARNTRAKYEPATGCYLGAFIDFDGSLKRPIKDQTRTVHQDPGGFEELTQKSHSMYFFYVGYGHPAPLDWIRWLGAHGKFVHIALEPNNGLKMVKDDAYLQKLADGLAKSGAKIFLRFGAEMNGDWSNYYKDPAEFRRKFRLVHQVMRRRAPNVATVWCPYTPFQVHLPQPHWNIQDYYPGDDGTDWVGVNMYSVTYHNNDLKAPGEWEHPCDLLNEVYDRYAARKPVMICEYAATHYADCEKRARVEFATRKIGTLYAALPRLYPRVKCINYFDSNNIQFTDHINNDYSVTNEPTVLAAYRAAIHSPYFLDRPLPDNAPPAVVAIPMPLRQGETLRGNVELSCFARAPGDQLTARYKIDGYAIYTAKQPDQWICVWDAGSVKPGRHSLVLEVIAPTGKVTASQTVSVITAR